MVGVMATIELLSRYGIKFSIRHWNWGEFYRLSRCKIHFLVGVFGFAKGGLRHWKCGRQTLVDLGMAFVDNWVVG